MSSYNNQKTYFFRLYGREEWQMPSLGLCRSSSAAGPYVIPGSESRFVTVPLNNRFSNPHRKLLLVTEGFVQFFEKHGCGFDTSGFLRTVGSDGAIYYAADRGDYPTDLSACGESVVTAYLTGRMGKRLPEGYGEDLAGLANWMWAAGDDDESYRVRRGAIIKSFGSNPEDYWSHGAQPDWSKVDKFILKNGWDAYESLPAETELSFT